MLTRRTRRLSLAATLLLAAAPAAAAASPVPAGDPRNGESIYVGTRRLENGGAPCLACHGIAGHALARAASFGPDLTTVHATWGGEALEAALAEMPFPSMAPIYSPHVLTASERRDLSAFLAESAQREPPRLSATFALGVAGAGAAFLLLFSALGRRRTARRASSRPASGATP